MSKKNNLSLSPTKKKRSDLEVSEHQMQRQQLERELNRMESVLRQGLRTSVASHCIVGHKNAVGDESVSLLSLEDDESILRKQKKKPSSHLPNMEREGILEDLMRQTQYSASTSKLVIPKASSPTLQTQKQHSSERDLRRFIQNLSYDPSSANNTASHPRPRSQSPAWSTKNGHRRYATTDTNFAVTPSARDQQWSLEGTLALSKSEDLQVATASPSKFLRGRSIRSFKTTSQSTRSLTPPGGGGSAMPPKSPASTHHRRKLTRSPVPPTRQQGHRNTTTTSTSTSNSTAHRSPSPTTASRGRHRTKSPHQRGSAHRRNHGSSSKSRDPDGKEQRTTTINGLVSAPSQSPTRPTTSTNQHRQRLVQLPSAPLVVVSAPAPANPGEDEAYATPPAPTKRQGDVSPVRAFHTRKLSELPHHRSNNKYVNDDDDENCGFVPGGVRSISLSPTPTRKSSITNDFNFGDSMTMDDYWAQATTTTTTTTNNNAIPTSKSTDDTAKEAKEEGGSTHRRKHHHHHHHRHPRSRARSRSQGRDKKSTTSTTRRIERERERERASTTTPPRRNMRRLVRSSSSSRRHIQKSTALLLLDVFQVQPIAKEGGQE